MENKNNKEVPVVNFTEFCNKADLGQIKKALKFYNKPFKAKDVLKYFKNWTIVYDDSKYKNGVILTNKHSNGKWETSVIINDNAEYSVGDDGNWQYVPITFSEFISDVLRYADFELILSKKGIEKIYGKINE